MAAILMTTSQRYIGTAADKAATTTTNVKAGSTFIETDTSTKYIWDGSNWKIM